MATHGKFSGRKTDYDNDIISNGTSLPPDMSRLKVPALRMELKKDTHVS